MTEQNSTQTIKKYIKAWPKTHIQRVEDSMSPGIADMNVCHQGFEFWLEGKFLKDLPVRDNTLVRVGLTPEQATWLETRQRAGGCVFVWIRVRGYGWLLFEDQFRELQHGIIKTEFMKHPVYATGKLLTDDIYCEILQRSLEIKEIPL